MNDGIRRGILERANLYRGLRFNPLFIKQVMRAHRILMKTICRGGKILIFGNGGSAAEAQHFATELVCMFEKRRRALAAIALTTDSSILTAQSNDYGFETIFSRQIQALCNHDDSVIGLTTGNPNYAPAHSINIVKAFQAAKDLRVKRIGLFGQKTAITDLVNVAIVAPSMNTALTQEIHLCVIHMLCSLIENDIC